MAAGAVLAGRQLVHVRSLTADEIDGVRWRLGLARWTLLLGGSVLVALSLLSFAVD